jgi:hypothetical protein
MREKVPDGVTVEATTVVIELIGVGRAHLGIFAEDCSSLPTHFSMMRTNRD